MTIPDHDSLTNPSALGADTPSNAVEPLRPSLPGEAGIPNVEQRAKASWSKKGLLGAALLLSSVVTVAGFGIARLTSFGKGAEGRDAKLAGNRPTAATTEPRKLDLPLPRPTAPPAPTPRVPAIVPTTEERAEPIGVKRTEPSPVKPPAPEDAPVMLVTSKPGAAGSTTAAARHEPRDATPTADNPADGPLARTRENLEAYQRQLHGLLNQLTRTTTAAATSASAGGGLASTTVAAAPQAAATAAPSPTLIGGVLPGSATPRVSASTVGNRSLTLPKGTAFTCALKTRVISATSGLVGCQVQRNVYGDDGRVLLVERGSHMDGEYRIASVRPGTVRIPVLWTRIRTPHGVTVDIESPSTGALGEGGIDGHVDNRWFERIGAAMLLSLIDDSVKLVVQEQTARHDAGDAGTTIVLPSTTANASKLAEKVLDSTINIPPLIYQNQGGVVGVVVARDVDFSAVYELRPTDLAVGGRP